jgi:hypothetical protein
MDLSQSVNNQWHICSHLGCKRKYRSEERLLFHLNKDHNNTNEIPQFYPCTIQNCNKKYKSQERLNKHLDDHSKMNENHLNENHLNNRELLRDSQISNLFYICPEFGCTKKFREKDRMIKHIMLDHKIADDVDLTQVQITKTNKKEIFKARDDKHRKALLEKTQLLKQEAEKTAKCEAEKEAKLYFLDKYKTIEDIKLRLEQENLTILQETIQKGTSQQVSNPDCCICQDKPVDTAVVPCGHMSFCYGCIDNYHKMYPQKGCPVCRSDIITYTKIYS